MGTEASEKHIGNAAEKKRQDEFSTEITAANSAASGKCQLREAAATGEFSAEFVEDRINLFAAVFSLNVFQDAGTGVAFRR